MSAWNSPTRRSSRRVSWCVRPRACANASANAWPPCSKTEIFPARTSDTVAPMQVRLTHLLLAFLLLCAQVLLAAHTVSHTLDEGDAPQHACELCLAAHA